MTIYCINGKFVEEKDAKLPIHDLAILRGYGVFDFLRTYNSIPFHLRDHLNRLLQSAKLLRMKFNTPVEKLEKLVYEALERKGFGEANIRIIITGGISPDNFNPSTDLQTILIVSPLHKLPPEWYTRGAGIITCNVQRFLPGAKSINYIPGILALQDAKTQGAIEAVYADDKGFLLEGSTSNFFGVRDNTFITCPNDRILEGITRQVVLELCRQCGAIEFRYIHQDEIPLLDEAFITASNKEIIPISRINSLPVIKKETGKGEPGPMTQKIMQLFHQYTQDFRN